jgi:hypothetical protein
MKAILLRYKILCLCSGTGKGDSSLPQHLFTIREETHERKRRLK